MKRYLALIIFFTFITAYAINTISTGYSVAGSSTKRIYVYSICKDVTNNTLSSIFVPTNTSAEWLGFLSNLPAGVTTVVPGVCP